VIRQALASIALGLLLAGCQARAPESRVPPPPPAPSPAPAPRAFRVAVVDLQRAARAHPRWPEVQALDRRIGEIQAELAAQQPPQVPLPRIDLSQELRAEAAREAAQLQLEYRKQLDQEVAALQEAAKRELAAYVATLRADQESRLRAKRAELEAQLKQAVQAKQQEIARDNEQFQLQTLEQYRLPLLNLRLKLETGAQDKQQSDRLNAQLQSLVKERDGKIAAHEKANQKAFQDFQEQQVQASNQELAAYQQQLAEEGRTLVDQKAAEINARLRSQVASRQAELQAQLNARLQQDMKAREQVLVAGARAEVARAREQALGALRARDAALRAQLQAVQAQRARLLESIMADLRVEAAALAQQQGWDLILTQTIATVDATDVTDALIARVRR